MFIVLMVAANALLLIATLARYTGRISTAQVSGVGVVASGLASVGASLDGIPTVAACFAGLGAMNAWIWWNDGGGDGTRRRLKSWARRFRGVRRTASASA